MTDTAALRELIDSKGLKHRFIAKSLGLSGYGFSLKLNNKNEFKASEIATLCNLLEIAPEEMDKIFFAKGDD